VIAANLKKFKSESLDLGEHTEECGLIEKLACQQRRTVLAGGNEIGEAEQQRLAQKPADADLAVRSLFWSVHGRQLRPQKDEQTSDESYERRATPRRRPRPPAEGSSLDSGFDLF
jgi:hypothetical protein